MAATATQHSFSVPWLRQWIARTPGWSKAVAIGTNIPHRIVRSLRDGHRGAFKDYELAAFFRFFGVKALNDWLREFGFGGARKLEKECPHQALAKVTKAGATLAEALADNGRVDHHELPEVNAAFAEAGIAITFDQRVA